jgi:ABC-type glycerol-3-phosphate transport system permease component
MLTWSGAAWWRFDMLRSLFQRKTVLALSPIEMIGSYLILGFWLVVVLFPLYWLLITSLTPNRRK